MQIFQRRIQSLVAQHGHASHCSVGLVSCRHTHNIIDLFYVAHAQLLIVFIEQRFTSHKLQTQVLKCAQHFSKIVCVHTALGQDPTTVWVLLCTEWCVPLPHVCSMEWILVHKTTLNAYAWLFFGWCMGLKETKRSTCTVTDSFEIFWTN